MAVDIDMTNSYNSAAEYLNKMRQEIASKKSSGTALLSTTSEYILPVTESSTFSDNVSATSATIGDYDVVNNSAGTIWYWPFDLDLVATDTGATGGVVTGTVTGTTTYVTGPELSSTHKLRNAFSFNGSSYITMDNEPRFDVEYSDSFNFSFWFKTSSAANMVMISKHLDGGNSAGWYIVINVGKIYFVLINDFATPKYITVDTTLRYDDGLWHHCVFTYNGTHLASGCKGYIDGTLLSLHTTSDTLGTNSILNNQSLVLGALADTSVKYTGSFGHFYFIGGTVLTAAQVTRLYAGKQISVDAVATNPAYIGFSDVL